jgi:hypothetical protein
LSWQWWCQLPQLVYADGLAEMPCRALRRLGARRVRLRGGWTATGAERALSARRLISDIYLDGAISEVATRRSEFAAILKSDGIDGLVAALNRKADILTGTTAKSF